jgi:hypothetical protein
MPHAQPEVSRGSQVTTRRRFTNPQVAAVFEAYPNRIAAKLMRLRQLIFETAASTDGVGALEETLRWQQPSYLTATSGSGSAIRIDQLKSRPGKYAMYFHCQTSLVDTFRTLYPSKFTFEGNRAIVFDETATIPVRELRHCISLALTYRLRASRKPLTRSVR